MRIRRHRHPVHRQEYEGLPPYGTPDYRNRPSRSGLDPIDAYAEWGRILGLFIRNLFSGRLRTRNPVFLILMTLVGIICLAPEMLALGYRVNDGGAISICVGPLIGIMGLGLLANALLSLVGHA